jgi:hypothetical protein
MAELRTAEVLAESLVRVEASVEELGAAPARAETEALRNQTPAVSTKKDRRSSTSASAPPQSIRRRPLRP